MNTGELSLSKQYSKKTQIFRGLLFSILKQLKEGYLEVYEDEVKTASFGNINDVLRARIYVKNNKFYSDLLLHGSIGVGESYIEGNWDSDSLLNTIRIFARNLEILDKIESKFDWLTMPSKKVFHYLNRNSKSGSKKNISAHYDLGNELYTQFLDPKMQYSSAIYKHDAVSLEQAQTHKLEEIARKLDIKPGMKILEIGTGWGGLAIHLAENHNCHITTTTISEEQYRYAKSKVKEKGLEHKIELLKRDYRELDGRYDRIVSIEMIEAVGKKYLKTFVEKVDSLLKQNGKSVLQSITIRDQRMKSYENSVDFIQRHIFPGGFLPSIESLSSTFSKNTSLSIENIEDIGISYANTLRDWNKAFHENYSKLNSEKYDLKFKRLWEFYFLYCEAGFRERSISCVQLVLRGPKNIS